MNESKLLASMGEWGEAERLVHNLLHLPHKIQCHHDVDDLAHLVLHDLGHDAHFGLNRAIYLVDNPEFNCIKGVAGFSKCECALHHENVWETPDSFAHDMKDAQFHQAVKEFSQDSSVHHCSPEEFVKLGERLGLKNPSFFTWNMRHGNHGVLLFEEAQTCARKRELLHHAASLLSLC